jgi:hypothetical protein
MRSRASAPVFPKWLRWRFKLGDLSNVEAGHRLHREVPMEQILDPQFYVAQLDAARSWLAP